MTTVHSRTAADGDGEHAGQARSRATAVSPVKSLTLFGFFAITASMVMALYEWPTFATAELLLVTFLLLGGFFWFIPVALCAAEMATVKGWENGGIFKWVSATLGERWGFAAIFFQWLQVTVGFVTMTYFILGALGYVFEWNALSDTPWVKFCGVLVVFWLVTISQFAGTTYTARIAKAGFIGGILIPGLVLVGLAIAYAFTGGTSEVTFSWGSLSPDFGEVATLVVFVSFILSYMGVEASASHVNEMVNPRRDYPLAMFVLVVVAIGLSTVGGLSVAATVPQSELSLSSGVVQAYDALFTHLNPSLGWLAKVMAVMIAVGVLAEVSSWVVGPARGMYTVARQGLLPQFARQVNRHDVPVKFIVMQGGIVTAWAALLTFGSGSNGDNVSFMTAISLTVVIYLAAYLLFFVGYIVLATKKRHLERAYQIPGGVVGKVIIAGVGLALSAFALVISFFTPSNISAADDGQYTAMLTISFIIVLVLPFVIYAVHDKRKHLSLHEPRRLWHREVNRFAPLWARGEHAIDVAPADVLGQDEVVNLTDESDSPRTPEPASASSKVSSTSTSSTSHQ